MSPAAPARPATRVGGPGVDRAGAGGGGAGGADVGAAGAGVQRLLSFLRRPASDFWTRYTQVMVWSVVGVLMTLLLAVFSSGLFFYAVLVVGIALAASLLFASVAVSRLHVSRAVSDSTVAAGQSVEVTLTIENRKSLPVPWLFCEDHVEDGLDIEGGTAVLKTLPGGQSMTISYKVSSKHRGLYRIGPSVTEASDPLGFVRRFKTDKQPEFITVAPKVCPIGRGWPLGHSAIHRTPRRRSLFEDPSRFVGIRDYQPSDSIRRIHWRATARLGSLQVKTFEPAVLQGALLLVDGAPTPDDELFELTVTTAASVAEYILFGGQKVGLLSNGGDAADRYPRDWKGETFRRIEDIAEWTEERRAISGFAPLEVKPGRGSWQAERIRAALGRMVAAAGVTLAELLEVEMPRIPRNLVTMVITRSIDDRLLLALDGLRRSGVELSLMWIRPRELSDMSLPPLPDGVPVHVIGHDSELENLGAHAL